MARPEYIALLHEAKYELRFCPGPQKAEHQKRYREVLKLASERSGVPPALLEAAVAKDFGKWVKDEKLPALKRLSDSPAS